MNLMQDRTVHMKRQKMEEYYLVVQRIDPVADVPSCSVAEKGPEDWLQLLPSCVLGLAPSLSLSFLCFFALLLFLSSIPDNRSVLIGARKGRRKEIWATGNLQPFSNPCALGKIPGRVEGHECSPVVAVEGMCLLPLIGHPAQSSARIGQFRKQR